MARGTFGALIWGMTDLNADYTIEITSHGLYIWAGMAGAASYQYLVIRADDWTELLAYVSFGDRARVRVCKIS